MEAGTNRDSEGLAIVARTLVVAALGALLVILAASGLEAPSTPRSPMPFAPIPFGGSPPSPALTAVVYFQEGATIASEDGLIADRVSQLRVTLKANVSPYATSYEINGLSNTGDWYQAVVSYNWPGCQSGFQFAYEVWNSQDASVIGPLCDVPVGIRTGDPVTLVIDLACPGLGYGYACLTFANNATGASNTITLAQPDPGGVVFENLQGGATPRGYFTGPMTEVVDTVSLACGAYPGMPTIDYRIRAGGAYVSGFIPWSDEFLITAYNVRLCFSSNGTMMSVGATPVSQYADSTVGNAFGPHWAASQNWSVVRPTEGGWRFETDAVPLRASLSLSRTRLDVGQNLTATGNASGGATPYTCRWTLDNVTLTSTACSAVLWPLRPGILPVRSYLVGRDMNYAEADGEMIVFARPSLSVAANPSYVVVGSPFTIAMNATGGLAPYVFNWSGLPPGCAAPGSAASESCTPTTPGAYTVNVTMTDAVGMFVHATAGIEVAATILGLPPLTAYLLLEAVAGGVALAVILGVFARRERRHRDVPSRRQPPGGKV